MGGGAVKCAAVAMIFENNNPKTGKLLCVWNKRYNGWSMPGGRVEDGESILDGLTRELLEEVGIVRFKWLHVFAGPHNTEVPEGRASYVYVYSVFTTDEPRAMEDGCPITWLTPAEFLEKSPFAAFYKPVFEKLGLA